MHTFIPYAGTCKAQLSPQPLRPYIGCTLLRSVMSTPQLSLLWSVQLFVFPASGRNCQLIPSHLHWPASEQNRQQIWSTWKHTYSFGLSRSLPTLPPQAQLFSPKRCGTGDKLCRRHSAGCCAGNSTLQLQNIKPSFYQGQLDACLHIQLSISDPAVKALLTLTGRKAKQMAYLMFCFTSSNHI